MAGVRNKLHTIYRVVEVSTLGKALGNGNLQ